MNAEHWVRITFVPDNDDDRTPLPSVRFYHCPGIDVDEAIRSRIHRLREAHKKFQRDGNTLTYRDLYGARTLEYFPINPTDGGN